MADETKSGALLELERLELELGKLNTSFPQRKDYKTDADYNFAVDQANVRNKAQKKALAAKFPRIFSKANGGPPKNAQDAINRMTAESDNIKAYIGQRYLKPGSRRLYTKNAWSFQPIESDRNKMVNPDYASEYDPINIAAREREEGLRKGTVFPQPDELLINPLDTGSEYLDYSKMLEFNPWGGGIDNNDTLPFNLETKLDLASKQSTALNNKIKTNELNVSQGSREETNTTSGDSNTNQTNKKAVIPEKEVVVSNKDALKRPKGYNPTTVGEAKYIVKHHADGKNSDRLTKAKLFLARNAGGNIG